MKLKRIILSCMAAAALMTVVGCTGTNNTIEGDGKLALYLMEAREGYTDYRGQSIHMAISTDGKKYEPLYNGYGILFAKCGFNENDGIISKGVTAPAVYKKGGSYIIVGKEIERTTIGDEIVPKLSGSYVVWKTEDFITFTEAEVVEKLNFGSEISISCELNIEGAYNGCEISLPGDILAKVKEFYAPLEFLSVDYPKEFEVSSEADLDNLYATVTYSDGSTHQKKIELDTSEIDFTKAGRYKTEGKISAIKMPFPLEERPWGDPVIKEYEGKFYFFGTNDWETGCFELRRADTLEDLFNGNEERGIILSDKDKKFTTTFWAPELFEINGKMYIFCALTPGESGWNPQAYVMELKEGGDMLKAEDWSEPKACVFPDGRMVGTNPRGDGKSGIGIDMTYFEANGKSYVAWSYRTYWGTDSGSMILIAETDPNSPWHLKSEATLLTRPEYGWENTDKTDNNEGPNCIVRDGKVYLFYSAANAGGDSYSIGLLTADENADLLDLDSWEKSKYPVLASDFVEGERGCGHHSFYYSSDGNTYILYHGHKTYGNSARIDGMRRVQYKADGTPYLALSNEQDIPADKLDVKVTVIVK